MAELIDDLLELSRVSRTELRHEAVDLSALADAVLAGLRAAEPAREVVSEVAPGLRCTGDPRLLRVVFENLLGNAWKFTSRRAVAHIRVDGDAEGGDTVVHIRDDGAGFDPTYADKLFAPFQRLHAAAEFPGTGIGLATVRRVVSRHGGRVWADGAPGAGATFHLALPAATPSAASSSPVTQPEPA
jgi:signal transduction histidine kinase